MDDPSWLTSRPPERIEGEGLTLRRVHRANADDTLAAVRASLPELAAFMPWAVPEYGPRHAKAWVDAMDEAWPNGAEFGFVLTEPGVEGVSGSAGLINRLRHGWLEIGYWVRTDRTGEKLARRATVALITAVRAHMPEVEGVEIHHDEANLASQSVPAALGFTRDRVIDVPNDSPPMTGRNVAWTLPL